MLTSRIGIKDLDTDLQNTISSKASQDDLTRLEDSVENIDAVPTGRKINGKTLTSDITLSASDVSARPNTWTPTASEVGARPSTWTPTASDVGAVPTTRKVNGKALSSNISLSASDVGARPNTWTPTASDVGLGNVNNTSDANKPVSTAQATAIADAKKAGTDAQTNLNKHINNKSNPHGVTASQIGAATTSYVDTKVSTAEAKIPTITASTTDITAGSTSLPANTLYLVYE